MIQAEGRELISEWNTVVVGAGAAGLAAAARLGGDGLLVIDRGDRVGDSWRHRYDGLRLFTPARYCALPGLPLPLDPDEHPDKNEFAEYLEQFARHINVSVRLRTEVLAHHFTGDRHLLTASTGAVVADRLVWAGGAHQRPVTPAFADALDPSIRQLHSAVFRNPADVPSGPILVVGAGQSGADIAAIVATAGHRTYLAGPPTGQVPAWLASSRVAHAIYDLPAPRGLLRDVLLRRGSPLLRRHTRSLAGAGVSRVDRVAGVHDGLPVLANGRSLAVATVIWCTGLRPDLSWLDPRAGSPRHRTGVSDAIPSLGFVGLRLQHTLASGYLAGMSSDAAAIARRLNRNVPDQRTGA